MKELVLEMFRFMFGGGMFESMRQVLTENPSLETSKWNGAWNMAVSVYDTYIIPIGIGIMVIWFLVAFCQKAASEQMNFDQIFLLFVKLIVSFYLIQHGMELFSNLWGLGIGLMNDLMGGRDLSSAGVSNAVLAEAWADLTGGMAWGDGSNPQLPGFWRSIGCFAQLMFPWLICAALSGCATFIAYSRMLEMLLRIAISPIALSDFFNEGLHSSAWRYIKTFLAICLQGFCILLIGKLYGTVASSLITGGGFMDAVVQYLVVSFAAVALMFKSLSFCKEVVGA